MSNGLAPVLLQLLLRGARSHDGEPGAAFRAVTGLPHVIFRH
jgi:hypothetical protein